MTSGIQRPSGGGPAGPAGPSGPDDPDDVAGAAPAKVEGRLAELAAGLDRGTMRAEDVLSELIEGAVGPETDPEIAAELRSLMQDLIANDPYLAGLAREVGAAVEPGAGDE